MSQLLEAHPYLGYCVVMSAFVAGLFSIGTVVMIAGARIGRTGFTSFRAYAVTGICLAGAILGNELLPLSDDQARVFVVLLGGAALLALAAGFNASARERAADFGMRVTEGFLSRTLERNFDGIRSRLKPQQGGGRDDSYSSVGTNRTPNDVLDIDTAVSLGQVRVKARWAPPSVLPAVLRKNVEEFFEGSALPRMERVRNDGLESWGPNWRFEESSRGAAVRIFGRETPPLVDGGRRLYLDSIELRDGILNCRYERYNISLDDVCAAEVAVRAFASKLKARGDSSPA